MKKNKKMKWSFRYIIPGIIAVILLSAVFLSNKYIMKQSVGSIYNIDEAKNNFDNIKIGDSINYEVSGYSDWQVIGKDEYEGTIDVVSKTNTEDLTLEPNLTKQDYERIFQETANKYMDNNYAINARTVNQNDIDYFNYDNDFWLNNISDINISTSQSTWQYTAKNYKMYVIPYVFPKDVFPEEDLSNCNVGDIIEYSYNGVDRWVIASKNFAGTSTIAIPEEPIELIIGSSDDNISTKICQILDSFTGNCSKNYVDVIRPFNLPNLIPNFLSQQKEKIYIIGDIAGFSNLDNRIIYYGSDHYFGAYSYYYENGQLDEVSSGETIYTGLKTLGLGYRPVVTLKVKDEIQDKDKKEISSDLKVGDNVEYEAKGYKNWKVLSIDEDNNTIDIISGGTVKNLTLSGKEDWDNFEDIIQREVDEYKNGDKAKKATTVTSKDLKILKEIDKSILSRYWLLSKNTSIRNQLHFGSGHADLVNYSIDSIYTYKYNNYEIKIDSISIYSGVYGEGESYEHYKNSENNYTYTAGLRPVITLKLDSVEKIPEEDAKRIEESTEKQEKVFIKEQETKNKDYKGPKTVDDSTSSTGNNSEVKTNDNTKKDNIIDNNTSNVEKIVYKDKPFYKYGFYILLVICLIETLMLIIPKINKK